MLRAIATAAYLGLVLLQPAWFLFWNPPESLSPAWTAAAATGPLLALLPGVLADRPRTWIWVCYLALPYFIFAVVEAWASTAARAPAVIGTALTLVLFASLIGRYGRRRPGR